MVKFFSSWVKTLGLSIVIVSILEMLLPNNKTKKYIRMVMGIYILFTIISPFISNKELFDINNIDFEKYRTEQTSTSINEQSMDKRIEQLYVEKLQKDITKKLTEKNYIVKDCKVDAKISDEKEDTKINKIKLKLKKSTKKDEIQEQDENIENQMVTQIQKIKPVNTSLDSNNNNSKDNSNVNNRNNDNDEQDLKETDVQNIKKFLIEEYGVSNKCLEIN